MRPIWCISMRNLMPLVGMCVGLTLGTEWWSEAISEWPVGKNVALVNGSSMNGARGVTKIGSLQAAELPEDAEGIRFFETRIRPLLVNRCCECHGEDLQESGLRLDTWSAIQAGGGSGRAIVPGQPDRSLLMAAVRYQDPSLQMPPDDKLSDQEIADLARWIAAGAPHPERDPNQPVPGEGGAGYERVTEDYWSFQPLAAVELPRVNDQDWVRSPIDTFILQGLESAGLQPNPPSDKVTYIRRVTYGLTGLPPTPEEIADYLADDLPDADERLVDRLLASPQYGERWGRHWLDVARYADSNGLDENVAHGNAWRYRDWVVSAWNRDIPYDRFVREQIAGDLYPSDDPRVVHERVTATGFLSLGPKVLAEVDKTKMEMDIIDEQLDTLGRAFMGLTLGCARCHDHKFDPISAEDYYGLAGILKSTRTMETFKTIARWYEHEIPSQEELEARAAHAAEVEQQKEAIEQFVARATTQLQSQLAEGAPLPENPEEHFPDEAKAELKELREQLKSLEASPPEVSAAMGVTEGDISDLAVHLRGSHLSLGEVVPRRFPTVLTRSELGLEDPSVPEDASGRRELAEWLTHPEHPLTTRVMANRLWRWHFGRGLVDSPDNFGKLGSLPTHPELLDWLANELVHKDWSLKRMHRMILLSSTYRMSSELREDGLQADPENRLMWRAPLRRLEAEALRDGLLLASGRLDRAMGGSMLHVKNHAFFFDHTSKDSTSYDSDRRSLYLPIVRNNMYDGFQLFDYTDSSVLLGDRETTTVPTQALFMMNSDLLEKGAEALAQRIWREGKDDVERIRLLFLHSVGREPGTEEIDDLRASLRDISTLLAQSDSPVSLEADEAACDTPPSDAREGESPVEDQVQGQTQSQERESREQQRDEKSNQKSNQKSSEKPEVKAEEQQALEAWQVICQAILASNEFVYLR